MEDGDDGPLWAYGYVFAGIANKRDRQIVTDALSVSIWWISPSTNRRIFRWTKETRLLAIAQQGDVILLMNLLPALM